jgi:NAD(P)-dependent dehydrogenase (short-subunit alcohol dehydrogenase family)
MRPSRYGGRRAAPAIRGTPKGTFVKNLIGKIAVVTGGGSGIGRALTRQLVAEGCNVAICDLSATDMAKTVRLCQQEGWNGRVTQHLADVSSEEQMMRFAEEVARDHRADRIHLLFNNAGIGGGSFVTGSRDGWDKTFSVCWGGVYNGCRAFLPLLMQAEAGHIVNVSSVNGLWASLGPRVSQTAYSAAKFAVRGFTEALITDLKLNAPHIACSVVMPGHVGTNIALNSRRALLGSDSDALTPAALATARRQLARGGVESDQLNDTQIQAIVHTQARRFRDSAPTTAAAAAHIILEGVKAGRWRILVGHDAQRIDEMVRADPLGAYEPEFFEKMADEVGWQLGR